jgi:hypothetical protein
MPASSPALEPAAQPESQSMVADARWQLAQRIASSDIFAKSELLPRFLLHICELYLQDRADEIREHLIGVRVFGRPEGYNPGDDNIVRNYAVQLRKRLSLYFEREGWREPYWIEIPRGGYVPVFHLRKPVNDPPLLPAVPLSEPDPAPAGITPPPSVASSQASAPSRRTDWRMFFLGLAAALPLLLGAVLILKLRTASPATPRIPNPLWSVLFTKDRDTFIVPADSGLGTLQNLTGQPVTLTDYLSGKYFSDVKSTGIDTGNLEDLRTQRYTSMVDLNITSKLVQLPDVVQDHLIIRYARDLRMDDLKDGNAILLGAIHTDPWVSLLQEKLNFQFSCGKHVDDCFILNTHPAAGERSVYRIAPDDPSHETYAIVALLPNLGQTGKILLIEGLNVAGTEAAANLVLDDPTMRSILGQIKLHDGSLKPFELLIETKTVDAQALPAQVICRRLSK